MLAALGVLARSRTAIGRALEEGRLRGPVVRAAELAWGRVAAATIARHLAVPPHVRVVTVGGSTLGGSGKTPLAIACARELAAQGVRVALVGHAFRARPGRARQVALDDPLEQVGDEALVAARALGSGVAVIVAPSRAAAIAEAARVADVIVLDGVLQLAPTRSNVALLAVDAVEPWGRVSAVPPRGDLRAPVADLLAAADAVVTIGHDARADARSVSRGVWLNGALVPWSELRTRRIGLACALGRPDRVVRSLAHHGVVPVAIVAGPDHGPIPAERLTASRAHPRARGRRDHGKIDLWLATAKCTLHLPPSWAGSVATIDYDLRLSPELCRALRAGQGRGPRGGAGGG